MKHTFLLFFILIFSINSGSSQAIGEKLTLQQCIELALENNLSVRRSKLTVEQSEINTRQSSASRLPTANINGNAGINYGRSIDPTTNQFINQRIENSGVSGSTNLTLFNGLQQSNTVKQNKVDQEAAEMDLQTTINNISLEVSRNYLNVILSNEQLENAKFQLSSSQEQLTRTKRLVEIGSLAKTNELDLIAQVASNEVTLVNAENNADLALLTLKQSLLLPSSSPLEIVIPTVELFANGLNNIGSEKIFEEAVKNQPQIKSADLGIESARLGYKVATGARFPTITAGASFSTNYSEAFARPIIDFDGTPLIVNTGLFTGSGDSVFRSSLPQSVEKVSFADQYNENLSKRIGISITLPIFNGLRTHSNIQRSQIALQQAEIRAMEQKNILRQQIESAANDARSAQKAYNASSKQVEALEESFRAIQNQYNLGSANFTDYQVANNNLFRAKSDLVRSKYDFIFRQLILNFYLGNPLILE